MHGPSLLITDDRSYPAGAPFRLLLGKTIEFDHVPQRVGKWWTVSVLPSASSGEPVVFHFHEQADAVLLIAQIIKGVRQMSRSSSGPRSSVK